jgi:hypothetical protein
LLREEKVAAEPTDELHFLGRRPVVWFYLPSQTGKYALDLALEETVGIRL